MTKSEMNLPTPVQNLDNDVISNVMVYGLAESVKASKYPFATDISKCSHIVTKTVKNLAQCDKGCGEDTFLNGIVCQFDLTFSKKAWPQLQRYHFIDFVSSQSTMHCITKFDIKKQCNEWVDDRIIDILKEHVTEYNAAEKYSDELFYKVIYNIPSGFRLTARVTTNYRQLKTVYSQRRTHQLKPDWGKFCDFIEALPLSYLITGKEDEDVVG